MASGVRRLFNGKTTVGFHYCSFILNVEIINEDVYNISSVIETKIIIGTSSPWPSIQNNAIIIERTDTHPTTSNALTTVTPKIAQRTKIVLSNVLLAVRITLTTLRDAQPLSSFPSRISDGSKITSTITVTVRKWISWPPHLFSTLLLLGPNHFTPQLFFTPVFNHGLSTLITPILLMDTWLSARCLHQLILYSQSSSNGIAKLNTPHSIFVYFDHLIIYFLSTCIRYYIFYKRIGLVLFNMLRHSVYIVIILSC